MAALSSMDRGKQRRIKRKLLCPLMICYIFVLGTFQFSLFESIIIHTCFVLGNLLLRLSLCSFNMSINLFLFLKTFWALKNLFATENFVIKVFFPKNVVQFNFMYILKGKKILLLDLIKKSSTLFTVYNRIITKKFLSNKATL